MYRAALLLIVGAVAVVAQPVQAPYYLEREPVNGGAELVTIFGHLTSTAGQKDPGVPLISVLRDTLGDSDRSIDRLRYVWILTSARPTTIQRAASAISIDWFRAGTRKHDTHVPKPALDLASPAKTVWTNLLGDSLQATELDPLGMAVRASTRSYRGNFSDYRELQFFQALEALDGVARQEAADPLLPDSDFRELYARLSLSDHLLGGLVRDQNLSRYYDSETARIQEMRGHNWELLRQRAESSGLYFQPLALPGDTPVAALVWVSQEDLKRQQPPHRFEPQFLNISDPWTDQRLRNWSGYSEVRWLDSENRPVSPGTLGARPVMMIPLAFYSLDHPRVPLLLVDFRDQLKPKRAEMVRHGATVLVTGVLGITRFTNWPYFFGETTWTFVRGRHGSAVNRSARLRAYSEARAFLEVDSGLGPQLKTELLSRLDHLALNPLENGPAAEAKLAREQYAALIKYAQSPEMIAKLDRDRRKELASYTQSRWKRTFALVGNLFNPRPEVSSKMPDPVLLAKVEEHRRELYNERFLKRLLASSPQPEIVENVDEIERSVDALSQDPETRARIAPLIAKLFSQSENSDVRVSCLRALQHLNLEEARNELRRLAQDPRTGEGWREQCLHYLSNEPVPVVAAAAAGGQ